MFPCAFATASPWHSGGVLISIVSYQLIILNPQIDPVCSNLMPGEELCLAKKGEDCKKVYQVQPNDSCDEVAEAHGIDLSTLFHNNPQLNKDCTNLYIDEVCLSNVHVRSGCSHPNRSFAWPTIALTTHTTTVRLLPFQRLRPHCQQCPRISHGATNSRFRRPGQYTIPLQFFFSLAGLVSSLSLFEHRQPSVFFLRSRYVGFIWRYQAELPGAILLLHFRAM